MATHLFDSLENNEMFTLCQVLLACPTRERDNSTLQKQGLKMQDNACLW